MLYGIIAAVVIIAIVAFFVMKKDDGPPQVSAGDKQPKLPPKKAKPKKAEPKPKPKSKPKPPPEEEEEEEGDEEESEEAEPAADEEEAAPESTDDEQARSSLTPRRDVASLRKGLAKSRGDEGFFGRLRALVAGKKDLDDDLAGELEEALLTSDVGVKTTEVLIERVREVLSKGDLADEDKVWEALRAEAVRILSLDGDTGPFSLPATPTVVLMVGVNGAGKTTTIGKLATRLKRDGKEIVLAAGDTFRAAAVQQLVVWGDRVGCEVVRGKDGSDPGSVVFKAIERAQEIGADVVLADTAGRLHTKSNLMKEMAKIAKTAGKAAPGAPHEVLLVLDATNGQNALAQAREFQEILDLSGIVLTKLDGTAKGGMILGICDELQLPVRFIGLGERADDLHAFIPEDFVEAMFGDDASGASS